MENMVGNPSGTEHPGEAGDFKDADGPTCKLRRERHFPLLEEGRAPVQNRKADNIDEEVRQGQHPDDRIEEHLFADKGPEGFRRIVVVQFGLGTGQIRQPDRRGRVTQGQDNEYDSQEADGRRGEEAVAPVPRPGDDVAAEHGCEGSPNRMGGVPDRCFGGQFLRRHPPGKQMVARREAAALEQIVQNEQGGHDDDHRTHELCPPHLACNQISQFVRPAEQEVEDGTGGQTDGQMPPGDGPVRDDAVDELRQAVNNADKAQDDAEAGVGDAVFLAEGRHGEGEVLADKIEQGVADHRTDDDPPLPVFE